MNTTRQVVSGHVGSFDYDPLLRSFERHLLAEGKSASTRTHYLGAARQFLLFAARTEMPPLGRLKREHIEAWLVELREHYATATVLNRFLGLQQFCKWLLEEGEIRRDPMAGVKRPELEETEKDVVPAEVLRAAFKHLDAKKAWRDAAILAIFYDTGMRASELAGVKVEDVDIDRGLISLPHTKNKTIRMVHLSPRGVRYLDRYLRRPRLAPEYLINGNRGKMTGNGLYHVVRRVFVAIGYQGTIGPHDLRHTSATHVAGDIGERDMMTLYGWKNPKMVRHYAKQALTAVALEAHAKFGPLERLYRD